MRALGDHKTLKRCLPEALEGHKVTLPASCDTQDKVDELSPVSQLLKKARRRSILDLVLDQSALAISIAMGGAIVLMLTGTSLLEWYWIALLAVASLAVGLYRLRGRVPSEYRLAQRIDWKMNLADALSTATYFADLRDNSPRREEICAQQRHSAEEIARTIDPREIGRASCRERV